MPRTWLKWVLDSVDVTSVVEKLSLRSCAHLAHIGNVPAMWMARVTKRGLVFIQTLDQPWNE